MKKMVVIDYYRDLEREEDMQPGDHVAVTDARSQTLREANVAREASEEEIARFSPEDANPSGASDSSNKSNAGSTDKKVTGPTETK